MKNLNLIENLKNDTRPILGICVGMQIMANLGEEFGKFEGLGWIEGEVKKLKSRILPHIGWNNVMIKKDSKIFNGLDKHKDFYFVHSFHFDLKDKNLVVAETEYGEKFCSIFQKENIIGVQFHPEKSQKTGQVLLKNFLSL